MIGFVIMYLVLMCSLVIFMKLYQLWFYCKFRIKLIVTKIQVRFFNKEIEPKMDTTRLDTFTYQELVTYCKESIEYADVLGLADEDRKMLFYAQKLLRAKKRA